MNIFTKEPKYAVINNGYIFYNDLYKAIEVKYSDDIEDYFININDDDMYLEITFNPNYLFSDINYIKKVGNQENLPKEGVYHLYPLINIDGTKFIVSKLLYNNIFCIYYLSDDIISKDYIKKITSKKKPYKNNIGDDTYFFIFRGGYMKKKNFKTGVVEQKYTNEEITNFYRKSNLLYPITEVTQHRNHGFMILNKGRTVFLSNDSRIEGDQMEDVYVDGLQYANLVINTLQEAYPEVHFFTNPNDWGKEKNYLDYKTVDGKDFSEWCRFKVSFEDYNEVRREFSEHFGPLLTHAKVFIDFEYAALDTIVFRKRRTDFMLDQFISYYAKDELKLDADLLGDNTKSIGFPIHWIKDEALDGFSLREKTTSMLDNVDVDLHSMRFRAELRVVILRFFHKPSPILEYILTLIDAKFPNIEKQVAKGSATDEEKELIMDVHNKGGTLRDGDILDLKNAVKRDNVLKNLEGKTVEFTTNEYDLEYNEWEKEE